ncbi:MAG: hypothetical protein ACJ8FY_16640 [Gemmataceae bacterium]
MRSLQSYFGRFAFVSVALLGWVAGPASAQLPRVNPAYNAFQPAVNSTAFGNPNFRINPNLTLSQAAYNTAVVGQAISQIPPYAMGFNPYVSPVTVGSGYDPFSASLANNNPYYGSSLSTAGYPNPYMTGAYDPYSSALVGSADIINGQGRFAMSIEQSRATHEQVRQARIETRRKAFDEYRYERENTPTAQQMRERDQEALYRRSMTTPSTTEVVSGDALNVLLDHLAKLQVSGARGPSVPLEEATLKHINVRPQGRTGNAGMLKSDVNLKWPPALKAAAYEDDRQRLEEFIPKAIRQASEKGVDAGTLSAVREVLGDLQDRFTNNVNNLTTAQYIEGKRFLNSLDEAVQALGDADATNYFNHKYEAKGKTVAELVNYMREKGLRFAPAVTGDEPSYRALLDAMVAYDSSITQLLTRDTGSNAKGDANDANKANDTIKKDNVPSDR